MSELLHDLSTSWFSGTVRILEGLHRGLTEPFPVSDDPPPITPYEVIYTGGKTSLRYYRAVGTPRATPLLIVYALIKRPFILDLLPGLSVIENLTQQGFAVYLLDWIPPTRSDAWRGFDAYVNGDLASAVHAVQGHSGADQVSVLGYCFGALLSAIYTALYPHNVQNFLSLALPLDMSQQDIPLFTLAKNIDPNLLTAAFGNCPAWVMKTGFSLMAPVHHLLHKHVGLHRNKDREEYAAMFEQCERWMNSDVPMAGQMFREVSTDIFQRNLLAQGRFQIDGRAVNLKHICCPVLNVIGEYDDIVHPASSIPLLDLVGSRDKQNLSFPTGHIGVVVSRSAHKKLWPQAGEWLRERDTP
jgi:polyhydroxyalkanoate synthase